MLTLLSDEQASQVKSKYPRYWHEDYESVSDVVHECSDYPPCFISHLWYDDELQLWLVELADNNMWHCVSVVLTQPTADELQTHSHK